MAFSTQVLHMKTISLHIPSLAIGGFLGLLLTLTLGFSQTTRPTGAANPFLNPTLVGSMAGRQAARDLVFFSEGDPAYVVPQGRFLVLTGIGSSVYPNNSGDSSVYVRLNIDGVDRTYTLPAYQAFHSFTRALPEGSTVALPVTSGAGRPGNAFVTGYLEDA